MNDRYRGLQWPIKGLIKLILSLPVDGISILKEKIHLYKGTVVF